MEGHEQHPAGPGDAADLARGGADDPEAAADAGRTLLWFLAGMAIHVALDIPVHHDDGPLLLFPFEWTVRFRSPVSYWDPRHHGDVVGMIEYAVMAGLALYLLRCRIRRLWRRWRA